MSYAQLDQDTHFESSLHLGRATRGNHATNHPINMCEQHSTRRLSIVPVRGSCFVVLIAGLYLYGTRILAPSQELQAYRLVLWY
jgi:hypothetical protein